MDSVSSTTGGHLISDDEVEPGPDVNLKLVASTKVPGTKTPTITKLTSPGTTTGACVSSLVSYLQVSGLGPCPVT